MGDYANYGRDLFKAAGIVYIAICLAAIVLALWLPKSAWGKVITASVVLALALILPLQARQEAAQAQVKVDAVKARFEKAKALFDERCKTAGEKIYRTVDGVEGIFLMNLRNESSNFSDQYKQNDPYGYSGTGDDYIKLFIRGRSTVPTTIGKIVDSKNIVTYKYAEAPSTDGKGFVRYTTITSKEDSERITRNGGGTVPITKTMVSQRSAKFGIAWSDISTKQDRDNWIAGGLLKIIDLANNEVIAERIGYMFDKGLGNTAGGRSPWAFARDNACPILDEKNFYFFDRVLKP
jgi:hypothetical protein